MSRLGATNPRLLLLLAFALCAIAATSGSAEQPTPAAISRFNAHTRTLEARLNQEHASASTFIAAIADPQTAARLRNGELIIENRTPAEASGFGALLHDWRGTAFVPGATLADFERLMRGYNAYPQHYAPEIIAAQLISHRGDQYRVKLRLRQHHVITVVLDTYYDVTFGQLDPRHVYSISRSTRVDEIADPGTPQEHPLSTAQNHGFLWRINIYWSCEQRDNGIYVQIESATLTRSVPIGLGWVLRPLLESVPRESLEFTLRATRDALAKK